MFTNTVLKMGFLKLLHTPNFNRHRSIPTWELQYEQTAKNEEGNKKGVKR